MIHSFLGMNRINREVRLELELVTHRKILPPVILALIFNRCYLCLYFFFSSSSPSRNDNESLPGLPSSLGYFIVVELFLYRPYVRQKKQRLLSNMAVPAPTR